MWQETTHVTVPSEQVHWHLYRPDQIQESMRGNSVYVLALPPEERQHSAKSRVYPLSGRAWSTFVAEMISQGIGGRIYQGISDRAFFHRTDFLQKQVSLGDECHYISDKNRRLLAIANATLLAIPSIEDRMNI